MTGPIRAHLPSVLATLRARLGPSAMPVLFGLVALATAGVIRYADQLREVRFGFLSVFLIAAGISTLWLLVVRYTQRALFSEARKFAMLLDAAPEAIVGVADDGTIRFANSRVSEIFGYTAAELCGESVEVLVPERLRSAHVAARAQYAARPTVRPMGSGRLLLARRKDGAELPVEVSLSTIDTPHERVVLCIVRDVTEQMRTRQALVDANRELQASVEQMGRRAEELRELTRTGELLQCCVHEREAYPLIAQAVARLYPQSRGALYLLNSSRVIAERVVTWGGTTDGVPESFQPPDCWALRRSRIHVATVSGNEPRCPHDADRQSLSVCVPMVAQGEIIGVLHACSADPEDAAARRALAQILRAIAEQSALAIANLRLREALRTQSIRDPLTGLYNRRFLDEWLDRELSRLIRQRGRLSVLLIDLDHFKRFNDTFGHQGGDVALREVCAIMQRTVRGCDVVCRFGGEEFAVLLPDAGTEEALATAEKLRAHTETAVVQRGGVIMGALTASIGVAVFPDHGTSSQALLQAADAALYAAKRAGRNRVVLAKRSDDGECGAWAVPADTRAEIGEKLVSQ
ncbi:MAG: diguanylate cyclase [Pseudomonadota bacterium]|jgi:diguanylate cyclase (GGDEF)-like protein/PAS domain S-box-containing protein|nr:MAG: hypothetical protein DIU56_03520 [Pseudomonadota bacterium]